MDYLWATMGFLRHPRATHGHLKGIPWVRHPSNRPYFNPSISHGHPTGYKASTCSRNTHGMLRGYPRATHGPPVKYARGTPMIGLVMGISWAYHGHPMNSLPWASHVYLISSPWSFHEHPMGFSWASSGHLVDRPWVAHDCIVVVHKGTTWVAHG